MNVEGDIRQYISKELLGGETATLADDEPLISSGRVDSMGLIQILSFVRERFGVDLMAVGTPHDFDSVAALAAAVRRHQGGA